MAAARRRLGLAALAWVVLAAAAAAAPGKPAPAAVGARLAPLSEADEGGSHETGCTFSFGMGRRDYVQLIGDELMFRTSTGLQVCRIPNADAFMETKGAAAVCKGFTLRIRSTGRATHNEASDSSTGPAVLAIAEGRIAHTMRGRWGVAC